MTTTITMTTTGSDFDTILAIYEGSALADLTPVAGNDDSDPASGIQTSIVTFEVAEGQIYQLAVDGFDGASGEVKLNIGEAGSRIDRALQRRRQVRGLGAAAQQADRLPCQVLTPADDVRAARARAGGRGDRAEA